MPLTKIDDYDSPQNTSMPIEERFKQLQEEQALLKQMISQGHSHDMYQQPQPQQPLQQQTTNTYQETQPHQLQQQQTYTENDVKSYIERLNQKQEEEARARRQQEQERLRLQELTQQKEERRLYYESLPSQYFKNIGGTRVSPLDMERELQRSKPADNRTSTLRPHTNQTGAVAASKFFASLF